MKKFIAIVFLFFATANISFGSQVDYQRIYRELDVPTFSYIHNIDPGQYAECQGNTWSPYPLFRLTSPLYFKTITIDPGYYTLTPREYRGNYYLLFKESGLVKYIVPVYEKSFVPEYFYEEHLPKAKLSFSQKCSKSL